MEILLDIIRSVDYNILLLIAERRRSLDHARGPAAVLSKNAARRRSHAARDARGIPCR